MLKFLLAGSAILFCAIPATSQNIVAEDSLRLQVLRLQQDMDRMKINLRLSQSKFQQGMALATVGYTVTIVGGLMLGRSSDDLGQVLLVAGGATGITGTFLLVDSFKYLGRASGLPKKRRR